ncbi:type 1 glutamine amidotransferase domain-containing protein [Streptomyces sp. NBS 14/10]|uniref:type 1 glutamine amidotransferase domain-containing protein n=1 Tax=Streptomyces sp. NBS 14/10 TaxID=1945643 RepID=UPI000B7ED83C|nr:type 1 glutamine amidotransferase domain-containing protein [Streptomyces sp. NBS 14/10]KAK1185326.1 type 1 glutamine amidotransferase domain-containing protein [Streptomyces sp. NBS 14/10]NUP40934.1 type 1 glutamine amidotransferase domain-containing protein [Streptomyces sp.]NUS86689.1 type 1 glutamine amidotransferase domain-containing protein [Streptomyces sp.]
MPGTRKILLALTSHQELGETGRTTGFYVGEAAHPWKVLSDAGYEVDLVSVSGGRPPMDGRDLSDPVQKAFLEDPRIAEKLAATARPEDITPGDYDAILYVGGHGTVWDFPDSAGLARIGRDIYEAGGAVAAVCHGPAGLVNLKLSNGAYLVDGKNVAAFTNSEEAAVGLTDVVPFLLQSKLEERGAKHTGAPDFEPHVVVDGRLVTGQNPASATAVGEALVKVLV